MKKPTLTEQDFGEKISIESVIFFSIKNGKQFLFTSGEYLVSRLEAMEMMKACQSYLQHITTGEISDFNRNLRMIRQTKQSCVLQQPKISKGGSCFIYVMLNIRNGYYKIGRTKNVKYREKTLQGDDPQIEIILSFPGLRSVEKALHKNFEDKRIRGEWFALDKLDIEYIKDTYL